MLTRKIPVKWLLSLLVGSALVWLALALWCPQAEQTRLFYCKGVDLFGDFYMPRVCFQYANPYDAPDVAPGDRCYAAIGYDLVAPFPIERPEGGLLFTSLGAVAFVLAMGLVLDQKGRDAWLALGAVVLSAPFLFNLERANQIVVAAAGVLVFLVWKDAKSGWKRYVALFALAFAAALKIVPGIFALMLFKERRWRDLVILGLEGAALLFVPFMIHGGLGVIPDWIERMRDHMEVYGPAKEFGVVRIVGTFVRRWPCIDVKMASALHGIGRALDILLGLCALVKFFRCSEPRRNVLLLAATMVLLPGDAQYYALLYFVPVLLGMVGKSIAPIEAVLWFVMLCPLQIPIREGSLNHMLSNLALLGLILQGLLAPRAKVNSRGGLFQRDSRSRWRWMLT